MSAGIPAGLVPVSTRHALIVPGLNLGALVAERGRALDAAPAHKKDAASLRYLRALEMWLDMRDAIRGGRE